MANDGSGKVNVTGEIEIILSGDGRGGSLRGGCHSGAMTLRIGAASVRLRYHRGSWTLAHAPTNKNIPQRLYLRRLHKVVVKYCLIMWPGTNAALAKGVGVGTVVSVIWVHSTIQGGCGGGTNRRISGIHGRMTQCQKQIGIT